MRPLSAGLLLFLALGAPAVAAEPAALTAQTLEARLADAERRAAAAAEEQGRLTRTVDELRAKVSALTEDADLLRRRGEELDRSKSACQDREESLSAALDVCERTRLRAEDEKARRGARLDALGAAHAADLAERDRLLEECRGRAANLEASNSLLAAERQGAERESREKVDELRYNYDDLVASLRRGVAACQGRDRTESEEQSRGAAEAGRLVDALTEALRDDVEKGRVALSAAGTRVTVRWKTAQLLQAKSGDLTPGGRKALKEVARLAAGAPDRAVIVEEAGPAPGRPASPFSAGARVGALLQGEGGLKPGSVALVASPPPERGQTPEGPSVTLYVVPAAELRAFLPGAEAATPK